MFQIFGTVLTAYHIHVHCCPVNWNRGIIPPDNTMYIVHIHIFHEKFNLKKKPDIWFDIPFMETGPENSLMFKIASLTIQAAPFRTV
jgi:hypothetical protein